MSARAAPLPDHPPARPALGLRANWRQFALLVAVNAFVGGMVGQERTIVPLLAEVEFGITSSVVVVTFVASFGGAKALTNLLAGHLATRTTRRRVLIAGWLVGLPVPLLLIWAPSWSWVVGANVLLGINQGLTWSMTVNMKVDLVGPRRRGLAIGANETAGYAAVAVAAFLTGLIAQSWGVRPEPFYLGVGFAALGLAFSALFVRDTTGFVALEARASAVAGRGSSLARSFAEASWRRRDLVALSQAGLVKNLNDGMAWALLPLFFASRGLALGEIAILAAAYPLVWGALQIPTGWASDRLGRRGPIVSGMLLQATAIAWIGAGSSFGIWLPALLLLGAGTALVYPTLLAAVGDAVAPKERANALGVYRFWRDSGTVVGALLAGVLADLFGFAIAIYAVAALTAASGLIAAQLLGRRDEYRRA